MAITMTNWPVSVLVQIDALQYMIITIDDTASKIVKSGHFI